MEDEGRLLRELGVLRQDEAHFGGPDAEEMQTAHQWYNAMVSLRSAEAVRLVSFRGCAMAAAEGDAVAKALSRLEVLQHVDLMGCGVDPEKAISLLSRALPRLRAFKRQFEPDSESEDEEIEGYEIPEEHKQHRLRLDMALPPELNLAGNDFDSGGLRRFASSMGGPLRGLCVLNLSSTQVDDDCLPTIAGAFPMLEELHLHHTPVRLLSARPLVKDLRHLRLLNCDHSRVDGQGAERIKAAMVDRRSAGSPVPLEVWLRGLRVDASWMPLLHFCASKAQHLGAYRVKHGLQVQTRRSDKHGVKLHPEVDVRLLFGSADSATVTHSRVVSTKTALQLAQEAISELNLVAIRDEKEVHDKVTMELRRAYRRALREHSLGGRLDAKEFELSMLCLQRKQVYNDSVTESFDHEELLGDPEFATRVTLVVDVKHKGAGGAA
jgi:hypothetical protein